LKKFLIRQRGPDQSEELNRSIVTLFEYRVNRMTQEKNAVKKTESTFTLVEKHMF
jgi:hypothetical protein